MSGPIITSSGSQDPAARMLERRLPNGQIVKDLHPGELARELVKAGVEGASFSNGRQDNARAYDLWLAKIEAETGAAGVQDCLSKAATP